MGRAGRQGTGSIKFWHHRRHKRTLDLHGFCSKPLGHMAGEKRGDPVSLLILASAFRDEMPWMYELGMEAYRMAKEGTREEATAAHDPTLLGPAP
jgi:hypothetical protein